MQFSPIGSSEVKKADVRIVAATNVNLERAVTTGQFRLDLYYRLNVLPIHMPPLRERGTDIIYLLDFFVERANLAHRLTNHCWFSEEARQSLVKHSWPGNVRQLQNLVERLVIMKGGGKIELVDLPEEFQTKTEIFDRVRSPEPESPSNGLAGMPGQPRPEVHQPREFSELPTEGLNLTEYIENLENSFILQALKRTSNNKNQAAKLLGLNRTTLVERIKKRKLGNSIV